jgi:hypothetical protein
MGKTMMTLDVLDEMGTHDEPRLGRPLLVEVKTLLSAPIVLIYVSTSRRRC